MTFSDKGHGVDQLSQKITLPSRTETHRGSLFVLLTDSIVGLDTVSLEDIEGFGKSDFECPGLEFLDRFVEWFVLPSILVLVLEGVVQDPLVGLDQKGLLICEWRVGCHCWIE